MTDKPQYYVKLFSAVSDALDAIDQQNYGLAKKALLQGQITSESIILGEAAAKAKAAKS